MKNTYKQGCQHALDSLIINSEFFNESDKEYLILQQLINEHFELMRILEDRMEIYDEGVDYPIDWNEVKNARYLIMERPIKQEEYQTLKELGIKEFKRK